MSKYFKNDSKAAIGASIFRGVNLWAGGFGLGLLPASGTFGSALGVLFYLILILLGFNAVAVAAVTLFTIVIGFYFCHEAGKNFGKADHSAIIWDEVAGMLVTLVLSKPIPFVVSMLTSAFGQSLSANAINLMALCLPAFLLFRLFDIVKLPPARQIDQYWHHGFGVMLDDVVAGVFAAMAMWVLLLI